MAIPTYSPEELSADDKLIVKTAFLGGMVDLIVGLIVSLIARPTVNFIYLPKYSVDK